VCNNKAMVQLYALLYTPVDEAYPPGDGYLVHTVHDPWGTGKNALIIGASSVAGVAKGMDAFLKALKPGRDIVLPKLTLFDLGEKEMKEVEQRRQKLTDDEVQKQVELAKRDFARGAHRSVSGRMGTWGFQYSRTGNETLAKLYKEVALAWYESYLAKPGIYGGPWGMDMDFHLMEILPAWDLLEESPALSDEDRLKVTKVLFEFITTDVVRKAAGALSRRDVRHNHMTFPALGLFFAGSYFKKGYNCPEADHWLDIARACFTLQMKAAKPYEDCNGYGWLVPYHTMRYALATLDPTYFDNGNVRLQADYAILTMDNLGYQVPYGDTGSYQCWFSEIPFLRGAVFFHRDGRYAWVLEKKLAVRKDTAMYQYACHVEPKEPVDLLGARAIPLDKMYWETFKGPEMIPLEKAVDKVVMRSSFDPQRQYLLLDGLSNGGHMHYDGNSISRVTDRGRIWLADNDYIKSLPKYHNSMLVFKDGQCATIPPYCELEAAADGARFGLSQTVVRNYTGVDWHRTILWSKEKFFLVLDELVAQEPADYDFHCMWHTVGEAKLTGESLEVEQKGPRFLIKNAPGPRLKLTDDFELGKNWAGYEFAKPVVHSLRQVKSARLAKGERDSFANLLYASDDASPQAFSIATGDKGGVVVVAGGDRMVCGVGEPETQREIAPGLHVGARAFALGETTGLATGLKTLSWRDLRLRCDQPLVLELGEGRINLTASAPTKIAFACGEKKVLFSGKAGSAIFKDGEWAAELGVGKSSIQVDGGIALAGLAEGLGPVKPQALAPARSAAEGKYPTGKVMWSFRPELKAVLVTGNAGRPEAYATGATVSCSPSPLAANVFARPETPKGNLIENLLDGDEQNVQGSTMWEKDTPVTVTVDLKERCRISQIVVSAWYGSKSSKGKAFMVGRALVEVSDDNFQKDTRKAAEIADKEKREDWGKPVEYSFENLDLAAQYVRVVLTPRPGVGVYLAEVEVWGRPEGKPIEPAKLATGEDAFEKFTAHSAGDLDGDGLDEIIAGSNKNTVWSIAADGHPRWKFSTEGRVTTTTTANLEGGKQRYAIAGSEDCKVYALTHDGALKWSFELPYYKERGRVNLVFAADINGDGYDEVIAGGQNWRYYALDRNGVELWHYESVHGSTAGAAADLDGDGKMETLCGTEYYWWPCAGPDGAKRWSYSMKAPYATVALSANLHGKKERAAVFGSKDGTLHVLDHAGKLQWTFSVGDEVTGAVALDLNGDGRDEIVASSMSFNVFALDGAGECLWRKNLGDSVLCLTVADVNGDGKKEIVAGCEDGAIYALSGRGEIVGSFPSGLSLSSSLSLRAEGRVEDKADSAVTGLAPAHLRPGQKQQIIARTLNGFLTAIGW
jgi:hypothetical protein